LKVADKRDVPIIQIYESVANGSIPREAVLETMDEMLFANLDVKHALHSINWDRISSLLDLSLLSTHMP
jgi:hypothetical protein